MSSQNFASDISEYEPRAIRDRCIRTLRGRAEGTEPRRFSRDRFAAKRPGPFSRFVYFYARPRRISRTALARRGRGGCVRPSPRGVVRLPFILPLSALFAHRRHTPPRKYVCNVALDACVHHAMPFQFYGARKILSGFTRNER